MSSEQQWAMGTWIYMRHGAIVIDSSRHDNKLNRKAVAGVRVYVCAGISFGRVRMRINAPKPKPKRKCRSRSDGVNFHFSVNIDSVAQVTRREQLNIQNCMFEYTIHSVCIVVVFVVVTTIDPFNRWIISIYLFNSHFLSNKYKMVMAPSAVSSNNNNEINNHRSADSVYRFKMCINIIMMIEGGEMVDRMVISDPIVENSFAYSNR